jgi:uncharacterized protein
VRAIPADLDPDVVRQIDARLDGVEAAHGVRILWAIESGSRAWGFPSPDSDYDGRFLYVRPAADYVGLRRRRDVIETPLDHVYDVNGWDLRKALALLVRGNATVGEWLRSPIVYRGDEDVAAGLLALADEVVDRPGLLRHYLHVGRHNLALLESSGRLKKFFYALRPALCLRWLRLHPDVAVPPMDVATLLGGADLPAATRGAVEDLVAQKSRTREIGHAPVPDELRAFVVAELALAEVEHARLASAGGARDHDAAVDRADAFLLDVLGLRTGATLR